MVGLWKISTNKKSYALCNWEGRMLWVNFKTVHNPTYCMLGPWYKTENVFIIYFFFEKGVVQVDTYPRLRCLVRRSENTTAEFQGEFYSFLDNTKV